MKERLKVTLNLKPVEHITTYRPSVYERDYDVTRGGRFDIAREVVKRLSPAEEKVKKILENQDKKGMIALSIHEIPTKGLRSLFQKGKKPSVEIHIKEGDSKILDIDDKIDEKKLYDFLWLD